MSETFVLIGKPAGSFNLSRILYAALSNDFSSLDEQAYYVIRTRSGQEMRIYARDDESFYRQWIAGDDHFPTIPTPFEDNMPRQTPKKRTKEDT